MIAALKRLSLGFALILACSAVLLIADLRSRSLRPKKQAATVTTKIPIALLKYSSNLMLDDTEQAFVNELAQRGYKDGDKISLKKMSPEGDFAALNMMASQITNGSFPLVVTLTTPALQAVANANKDGKTNHVFLNVVDPVNAAGVGIKAFGSLDKPKHLTGIGTFQPIEELFLAAKELNPDLKIFGVVWSPAEQNSEACIRKARQVVQKMGVSLIEAPIESSKDIADAAQSLISRGADLFWVGCDVSVNNSIPLVVKIAQSARIPVVSNIFGHANEGTLFDLGANYAEVGAKAADIAADILDGKSAAKIPVENFVPQRIAINKQALKGLKGNWSFPSKLESKAETVIDENGNRVGSLKTPLATASVLDKATPLARKMRIQLISSNDSATIDEILGGIDDGFAKAGLVKNRDFELTYRSAQGDVATLSSIFDSAIAEAPDLYMVLSTTAMQIALKKITNKPIVFTYVADPFVIGAGKTTTDHLSNVTGVYTEMPFAELMETLTTQFPQFKRLGTLFCPSEVNSVINKDLLIREATKRGLTVETVPVTSPAELSDAALALLARNIDVITQISDNLSSSGFAAITHAADSAGLPIISFNGPMIKQGASVAISRDYFDAGAESAQKAALILRGTSPADIPFSLPTKIKKAVSLKKANSVSLKLPQALLEEAVDESGKPLATGKVSSAATTPQRLWNINLIQLVDAPAIEATRNGILTGLKESGLVEGKDYTINLRDAQGDMPTLSTLIDAALQEQADMIYTITTPAFQAVMQKVKSIPIVFALSLDPLLVGDNGTHQNHISNIAGVYDRSPFEGMLKIVSQILPKAKTIGTLYCPSEQNSVNFKQELEQVAAQAGLNVIAIPSNSPAEVSDAALALTSRGVDVICQIGDNLHDAAFPTIIGAASRARIPVFGFNSNQASAGAVISLANDHQDGGKESGLIAARIIRGELPVNIPYQGITKTKLGINLKVASELNINIPQELIGKADQIIKD